MGARLAQVHVRVHVYVQGRVQGRVQEQVQEQVQMAGRGRAWRRQRQVEGRL